ncbi:MAG: type II toxin-antitoxin system RelB/DinJ family antitoxin [Clostridiales bacterium]|nr:type II toxin-antitoxin system RelB/DinJ family antitoxin [Clostridiales bacterium]
MAVKENMTLRMDPELKTEASALFESLGLNLSVATAMFYRQALRCNGIPFTIIADEPNRQTQIVIEKAERGEDLIGPFDSTDDLLRSLDED